MRFKRTTSASAYLSARFTTYSFKPRTYCHPQPRHPQYGRYCHITNAVHINLQIAFIFSYFSYFCVTLSRFEQLMASCLRLWKSDEKIKRIIIIIIKCAMANSTLKLTSRNFSQRLENSLHFRREVKRSLTAEKLQTFLFIR